jgi:hypothetical protein
MVKISVVMGVYNAGALLDRALDSILMQTRPDFEVVLVDDGSSIPVTATDPRVRVIRHETNRGLTRALITGCAAARGEYIARHDAGDFSHPARLEKQAAVLESDRNVAFVSCHTQLAGPLGEPLVVHRGSGRATVPTAILDAGEQHGVVDGPTSHGSVMFRRDAYERAGGYRAAFYYGQDWDLWYRLAAVGTFQIVPEILYTACVTPDGISLAARGPQREYARLSHAAMRARSAGAPDDAVLAQAATIGKGTRTLCSRARGLYFIGEALRRNGDPRGRRYLARAAFGCPLLLKAWLRLAQSFI